MMSKSRVQMILCPPSPLHFKKWGDKSPLAAPPLPPLSDASNIYIYIYLKSINISYTFVTFSVHKLLFVAVDCITDHVRYTLKINTFIINTKDIVFQLFMHAFMYKSNIFYI